MDEPWVQDGPQDSQCTPGLVLGMPGSVQFRFRLSAFPNLPFQLVPAQEREGVPSADRGQLLSGFPECQGSPGWVTMLGVESLIVGLPCSQKLSILEAVHAGVTDKRLRKCTVTADSCRIAAISS